MIKLQDFAKNQGVTDRQIQRLMKKYAEELEGLFDRRGPNGTWLSDEACEILRGKMKQAPVAIFEEDPRLEKLEVENADLQRRLNSANEDFRQYVATTSVMLTKAAEQLQLAERAGEYKEKVKELTEDLARQKRESATNAHRASEAESKVLSLRERNLKIATELDREKKRSETAEKTAEERERELRHIHEKMAELQRRYDESQSELKDLKNQGLWDRIWNRKRKR